MGSPGDAGLTAAKLPALAPVSAAAGVMIRADQSGELSMPG